MASLSIPQGFYQMVFHWGGPGTGSQPVNVIGAHFADDTPTEDFATVIAATKDALCSVVCDAYALTQIDLVVGNNDGPPYMVNSQAATEPGQIDAAAAPPNCAYLLTKNTGEAGRRGKGRTFLPGVDEGSATAGGGIGSFASGRMVDAVLALNTIADDVANFFGFAIFHPVGSSDETPSWPVIWDWSPVVATQRRRLRS